MKTVKSETAPPYGADSIMTAVEQETISKALEILRRAHAPGVAITSPQATQDYLQLELASRPAELFGALWLSNRHTVIDNEALFTGTIDGASVFPREVVRSAIAHNAAAVIFYHNHPSGDPSPSQADKNITRRLQDALKLIDVRVLDHLVVGSQGAYSFAEHGLL